jgi:hypothetical protein
MQRKADRESPSRPAFLFTNFATSPVSTSDLNLHLTTGSLYENLRLLTY